MLQPKSLRYLGMIALGMNLGLDLTCDNDTYLQNNERKKLQSG